MQRSYALHRRGVRAGGVLTSLTVLAACGSSGGIANGGAGGNGGKGGGGTGLDIDGSLGGCSATVCLCQPLSGTCSNGKATMCLPDGSGTTSFECDPVQGMVCAADGCKGTCAPATLGQSYMGCDYMPTVTLNPVWSGFSFAVAVSNTATVDAHVTITQGATSVSTKTVSPGKVEVIVLPWVTDLKGGDVDACQNPPDPGATRLVKGGAYRLRSDYPVTVYQYSPLQYLIDPTPADCPTFAKCTDPNHNPSTACKAFSADSSILLPTNALTGNYTALAWPTNENRAGFIAVTATADNTSVKVQGVGSFAPSPDGKITGKGGNVTLNAGDVLELVADFASSVNGYDAAVSDNFGTDISGTRIRADHPVQVIAGHSCARVPTATTNFCDHLEESMFPDETLGKDYFVTYPWALDQGAKHVIRVAAIVDGTKLHFDPAIHADVTISTGVAPLEIDDVSQDVHITSDKPILVGQYMEGSTVTPHTLGDPSLSLAIPTPQFRTSYLFYASSTYDANYVNVIAPTGATVTLDNASIDASEFTPIGTGGYSVARHLLSQASDVHQIGSNLKFGIVVYGYGQDTSYMYPGGLDLNYISPSPIK